MSQANVSLWFPTLLCVIQRFLAQRLCICPRLRGCALLISLVAAIMLGTTPAETTSPTSSSAPVQATESLRRGTVTLTANLRASPSMYSEVIAVAKEGMYVEILTETERWYRVRSEDGVEAWIYKPLVFIERAPWKNSRPSSETLTQPRLTEVSPVSSTKPEIFSESQPESAAEQQGLGTAFAAPLEEWHIIPEVSGIDWFIGALLSRVRDGGAYVIGALVVALALSIALQLRASRQLRQAMEEMGQIVDLVHEIYLDGGLERASTSVSAMKPISMDASAYQPPAPSIEISPIEQGVLEALSDQLEVPEEELVKLLTEKGFADTLIRGIIADIVRKTEASGQPLVEVRHTHGRYSYRLRPLAMSKLGAP
jgi:SH3-like domain-containing protein